MSAEWESVLADIEGESACGVDISYDADYLDLEALAKSKPAVQFRPDETVKPAEEPNWTDVEKRSLAILGRSKDLRVALYLTAALLRKRGFAGLRDGLTIVHDFLERHWDGCYPLLDSEDNNDPTERLNVLAALALPPEDAIFAFRDRILAAPLCESRRFGRYGLRQVLAAAGEMTLPPDMDTPSDADIASAFDDTAVETQRETHDALDASVRHVEACDALLVEKLGAGRSINFDPILKMLRRGRQEAARHLERRGVPMGAASEAVSGPASGVAADPAAAAAQPGGAALAGAVNSAQDVLNALDRICAYYTRHEPSSPIPLLLQRARRLVGKSFTEIVSDMSPEAMNQINIIGGLKAKAEGE